MDLAPDDLRRRVLGAVGGEPERHGSVVKSPHRRFDRWTLVVTAAGALVLMAFAAAILGTLGFEVSRHARHGPEPVVPAIDGARATLRRIGTHAELEVSGMSEPPRGEVYEVWLDRSHAPPQATDALFTVTGAGNGSVEVPGDLRGVREVMVTVEPLGGSLSPTSFAVVRIGLPGS
jgi:hypothetical protein